MKPILFNTEIVRAILDGRKTVTLRAVKGNAVYRSLIDDKGKVVGSVGEEHGYVYPTVDDCPYQPGEILYVRETWKNATACPAGGGYDLRDYYLYKADEPQDTSGMMVEDKWHPSIHMPREAARIFLRVTDVGIERLQDINGETCVEEGISREPLDEVGEDFMLGILSDVWDSTVKPADRDKYGWSANPWVWVIKFERIARR